MGSLPRCLRISGLGLEDGTWDLGWTILILAFRKGSIGCLKDSSLGSSTDLLIFDRRAECRCLGRHETFARSENRAMV